MGAWIETINPSCKVSIDTVAPYMGAWIETSKKVSDDMTFSSHPTWVRGLKF